MDLTYLRSYWSVEREIEEGNSRRPKRHYFVKAWREVKDELLKITSYWEAWSPTQVGKEDDDDDQMTYFFKHLFMKFQLDRKEDDHETICNGFFLSIFFNTHFFNSQHSTSIFSLLIQPIQFYPFFHSTPYPTTFYLFLILIEFLFLQLPKIIIIDYN